MTFSLIWGGLDILLFSYLFYISSYNLLLSFAGLRKRLIDVNQVAFKFHKIIVLIPCYKDYQVILDSAKKAINQDYPKDKFQVIVIADTIPFETINRLRNLPVVVKEVSFEKSTKVKALNKVIESTNSNFDALVILDADNLMEKDFLAKFNVQFCEGSKVIQGQRLPKHCVTEVAYLDGLSEKINNQIFRKGSNNFGLSSSIAGSGFGGEFRLLESTLKGMDSIGGFDKELEILLLEKGFRTEYFQNLIVYEEKVENREVFQNQRKRWISSQYFYLRKYFILGIVSLLKGKISLFNSTILRNLQLPRIINFGLLPFIFIYCYFFQNNLFPFEWWIILIIGYGFSFILALPRDFYSIKGVKAVIKLPSLFLIMFKLLFKMKGANSGFIHTPKGLKR